LAAPLPDDEAVRRHVVVAALADQARRRRDTPVQPAVPSGFRNNPSDLQRTSYRLGDTTVSVGYRFDRFGRSPVVEIDGAALDIDKVEATPDQVTLTTAGVTRRYRVETTGRDGGGGAGTEGVGKVLYVDGPDGSSTLTEAVRFPVGGDQVAQGSALAPMPGGVVRVAVSVGETVRSGQLLVVLEAMKMEHAVHATTDGTVTVVDVSEGDQVETGRILVVVEPDDRPGGPPVDPPDGAPGPPDEPPGGPSDGRPANTPGGAPGGRQVP